MASLISNGRKIKVPRIYRDLDLSEYVEGLPTIKVWVNPPRRKRIEYERLQQAALQPPRAPNEDKEEDDLSLWDRFRGLWHEQVRVRQLNQTERAIIAWYAEMWSEEGAEAFTEERVLEFAQEIVEQDPELWAYMTGMTWRLIGDHRDETKKNWTTRSSTSPEEDRQTIR